MSLLKLISTKYIRAFSLLELSIVIVIIGIMIASILPAITQQTLQDKKQELTTKMNAIESALEAFRTRNNRLPCPAQPTLASNVTNFAIEAATPGTCTGGTPAATASGTDAVVGTVPVRALGLADDMAFDPWGRAFTYMVDTRITASGAYSTYPIDNTTIGSITIKSRDVVAATLSDVTTKSIATVMSHGPSGHGAYLPSGSRYSSGSTNADELENCNCTAAAAAGTDNATFTTTLNSSTSASGVTGYDDTLRYYTRGSFISLADLDEGLGAACVDLGTCSDAPPDYGVGTPSDCPKNPAYTYSSLYNSYTGEVGTGMCDGNYLANSSILGTQTGGNQWINANLGSPTYIDSVFLGPISTSHGDGWDPNDLNGLNVYCDEVLAFTVSGITDNNTDYFDTDMTCTNVTVKSNSSIGIGEFYFDGGG